VRKSASSIVALGILACVFLAIMAGVYMGNLPNKEDLAALEERIRLEHGHCLSSTSRVEARLLPPEEGRSSLGVSLRVAMRPDLASQEGVVDAYLDRIGQSVLDQPDWRGRIGFVQVTSLLPSPRSRTVTEGRARPAVAAVPAPPDGRAPPAPPAPSAPPATPHR